MVNTAAPPLRPAERSILFSGKSVRLSDDAQSAASSHAPKKECSLREVWRSQTCTSGSPFFARTCIRYLRERILYSVNTNTRRQAKLIVVLLTWLGNAVGVFNEGKSSRADSECRFSFFGEAKKRKCPVGTRRMVKATPNANHKAPTHFQAASNTHPQSPNPFSGCLILPTPKGSLKPHPAPICKQTPAFCK